jgi:adenylate kinase family enzyme
MQSSALINLILLGDPASGKGTQAARLIKKYRFYDFDMGREVRKPSVRKRFDYKGTTARGKLTPTAVVRTILHRVIRTAPRTHGILFNGHPKMIGEARLASGWLKKYKRINPFVIYLSIPGKETIKRAEKRMVHVDGKLIKRDDDTVRALKNRRRYYEEQISRTVAFFKKKYIFKKVSGMGTEEQVWKRIDTIMRDYLQKYASQNSRRN